MITKQERLHALENQVRRLKRHLDRLDERSNRYSWVRLAIFLGGAALCIASVFVLGWIWAVVIAVVTLVAFSIVAYFHREIERSITRHSIWLRIKSSEIARIELGWAHIPAVSDSGAEVNHPFATDLDITGERSLHQLINTAVSSEGSRRLRDWLLSTSPDLQTIQQRQALVQELAPLSRFRDKLTLKSMLVARNITEQWEGKRLLAWLDQHTNVSPKTLGTTLAISTVLSIATIFLIVLNILALLPLQYWVIAVVLSLVWFFARNKERGDLFEDTFFLRDAFAQLSSIFEYLETYPYGKHARLKKLCEPFFANHGKRPSMLARRISRIASATTLSRNRLFWLIINVLLPWDAYLAYRLHRYKALIAGLLPAWLATWFELEALSSFATFAYLNPEYNFPEVVANEAGQSDITFQASGLGHPLIPFEQKVVNDFAMNEQGEVVIITGSNMSGKSTFLRTLGVNLCLAYAGGPVNANGLRASLFHIYTSMRVNDSLTEGYSTFYAEVRRLKALLVAVEQSKDIPVFFLIDEIFKGTNNRERLIGSRAYIQALVGQNCAGVISTHDLELVRLAETLPQVKNYHFREDVIDGRMVFDYILRPGPCPTTNALKIMQMEGLPVPPGS